MSSVWRIIGSQPKAPETRKKMSETAVLRAEMEKAILACPLCGYWRFPSISSQEIDKHLGRFHRLPPAWHPVCRRAWKAFRQAHPDAPLEPPAPARREPSPARALLGYSLLLATRTRTRSELLDDSAIAEQFQLRSRTSPRSRALRPDKTAVSHIKRRFLDRCPGTWALLFEPAPYVLRRPGKDREKRRGKLLDKIAALERIMPLGGELAGVILSGGRDATILRLAAFGMPPSDIATLVGDVDRSRTEHVVLRASTADLVRARQGYQRRGADITALRIHQRRLSSPSTKPGPRVPSNRRLTAETIKTIKGEFEAELNKRGAIKRIAQRHGYSSVWVSKVIRGLVVSALPEARLASASATPESA